MEEDDKKPEVSYMSTQPPIFYVRYAHKAEKIVVDLSVAHDKTEVAFKCSAITVLDKGTGNFTLTFHFYDGSELSLDQSEVSSGMGFHWDVERLYITNTAQAGLTVKLLVEFQKFQE